MSDCPIVEALRAAIATATTVGTGTPTKTEPELIALGWATVETDRAIAELAGALGIAAFAFAHANGSTVLGSSAVVTARILDSGIDLAVVEPSTEGRLAAHLARHGEGPTIAWFAVPDGDPTTRGPDGPFGPERLLAARPDGLLRLLVVTPPGTIRR